MRPKLAIFDLDGVLCDLKRLHFDALNAALVEAGYPPISYEDHLGRFDGYPTSKKLEMLKVKNSDASYISSSKQRMTLKFIPEYVKPDPKIASITKWCVDRAIKMAVCSNARYSTIMKCLELLGIFHLFTSAYSIYSADGFPPKPSPKMILSAVNNFGTDPLCTVVFEDSPKGLAAAHAAGCRVVQVGLDGLTEEIVKTALTQEIQPYIWQWENLGVIIPAAGRGKRFADAGYEAPKPFISIDDDDKWMIQGVIENLAVETYIAVVVLDEHKHFMEWVNGCAVYGIPEVTGGTAETCLVPEFYDPEDPLLIANADQILEWDSTAFYYRAQNTELDGIIVTFDAADRNPAYSYLYVSDGLVTHIEEKAAISDIACTGLWFFKRSSDFVKYARQMIEGDIRIKGEFYISGVIRLMLDAGLKFGIFKVDRFHSLGTPEDLDKYLEYRKEQTT